MLGGYSPQRTRRPRPTPHAHEGQQRAAFLWRPPRRRHRDCDVAAKAARRVFLQGEAFPQAIQMGLSYRGAGRLSGTLGGRNHLGQQIAVGGQ